MNRALIIGRMTKDIEIRVSGETTVGRFTLAVNRQGKKDEADFISCVAFGKTAEGISKWTEKGNRIAVEGHIQTGSYTKQDGTKVYTTDVIVDRADYLDFKPQVNPHQMYPQGTQQEAAWTQQRQEAQCQAQPQAQGYQQQTWQQPQYQAQPQMNQAAQEGFMKIPEDALDDVGLPFN